MCVCELHKPKNFFLVNQSSSILSRDIKTKLDIFNICMSVDKCNVNAMIELQQEDSRLKNKHKIDSSLKPYVTAHQETPNILSCNFIALTCVTVCWATWITEWELTGCMPWDYCKTSCWRNIIDQYENAYQPGVAGERTAIAGECSLSVVVANVIILFTEVILTCSCAISTFRNLWPKKKKNRKKERKKLKKYLH